jgi:excinuclease ABC subunit C
MEKAAKELRFEEASRLKRERFALEHIEDVALIKDRKKVMGGNLRIEAYDIAHISGTNTVGAMVVVVGGEAQKNEYKKFKIKRQEKNDDVGNLREMLERRFSHLEWLLPDLLVIDGGRGQVNVTKKVLEAYTLTIPVVGVVKDERHKPKKIIGDTAVARNYEQAIILANSEAHRFAVNYYRKLRGKL